MSVGHLLMEMNVAQLFKNSAAGRDFNCTKAATPNHWGICATEVSHGFAIVCSGVYAGNLPYVLDLEETGPTLRVTAHWGTTGLAERHHHAVQIQQ